MRVLNTINHPIILLFNEKLAVTKSRPSSSAEDLFRKLARRLLPLVKHFGTPSIQLYGSLPFPYGGRCFEIDTTWTYPDGAIDGINSSFMVEDGGLGFQFILFDHQRGTIFETWLSRNNLDSKVFNLVKMIEQYCLQQSQGTFTIP